MAIVVKVKKFIPGFAAITIAPFIFTKRIEAILLNHEEIHIKQQIELLWIFFFIIYGLEYVINLFRYKFDHNKAYYNISFEKEAYANQNKLGYISNRKMYGQWRKK